MSKGKYTTPVCCFIVVLSLLTAFLFMNGEALGVTVSETSSLGYEGKIFDTSYVHTIDIVMDNSDWENFIDTAESEEYTLCTLVIDGEKQTNVAIRAKGNTSLSSVTSYGNDRYSFKIEFDHYDDVSTYYGLDKLVLNNNIQDSTLMKDYLTYRMMNYMDVASPLCSYVWVTVNGGDWGLYLALESVEDSFMERNYGGETGELYKPDSMSMGGGRGNGQDFDMDDFADENGLVDNSDSENNTGNENRTFRQRPDGFTPPGMKSENTTGTSDDSETSTGSVTSVTTGDNASSDTEGFTAPDGTQMPDFSDMPEIGQGGGMGRGSMGSDDVKLVYTDDDYDSYSSIFSSSKNEITDSDKERLIASLKQMNEQENVDEVVDVDSVIKYFVVHNFVVNFDSYTGSMIHNYYLYEENGVLSMIPWDYNLAFGGFMSSTSATELVNFPIDTPVSGGDVDSRPMLSWIFSNDEYTGLYHEYFRQLIVEYFNSGYFEQLIDETVSLISPYVEKDTNAFCTYEEFVTAADTLKEFCLLRAESVDGQLDGTIPSTSEGQTEDSSALIDASDVNTADMGGMGNRGGGFTGQDSSSEESGGGQEGMMQRESGDSSTSESSSSSSESAADAKSSESKVIADSVNTVSVSSGLSATVGYLGTTSDGDTDSSDSLQFVDTSTTAADSGQDAQGTPPGGFGGGGTPPDMNSEGGYAGNETTTIVNSDSGESVNSEDSSSDEEEVSEPSAEMWNQSGARGFMSQQSDEETVESGVNSEYILLSVSAFILLLGLLIAYKFKRY